MTVAVPELNLYVTNVHLDSKYEKQRCIELDEIVTTLRSNNIEPTDKSMIWAGDFNSLKRECLLIAWSAIESLQESSVPSVTGQEPYDRSGSCHGSIGKGYHILVAVHRPADEPPVSPSGVHLGP